MVWPTWEWYRIFNIGDATQNLQISIESYAKATRRASTVFPKIQVPL